MKLESRQVCIGCGHSPDPREGLRYRCPNAGKDDDVDHLLTAMPDLRGCALGSLQEPNPFVRYRELMHSWRHARRHGSSDGDCIARIRELDAAVEAACGTGFHTTPLVRCPELARVLGLTEGEVWIKDETRNVAGSHKARHLMGIALALPSRTDDDAPLGIASCGNAALAAAVLAEALGRPLETYVTADAPADVLAELERRGARVSTCGRSSGDHAGDPAGDPPGDPCMHRLEQRVGDGVLPFTVQGPSNGLTLEGGRTLGFELVQQLAEQSSRPLDRLFVQVGGGALASSTATALREAQELGALERLPKLHAVQSEAVHPLELAWRRFLERLPDGSPRNFLRQVAYAATHRSEFMRPWEGAHTSLASGILDDETYDWLAIVLGMHATGGTPVVATEAELARAHQLARELTDIPVCPTGSAGLAGALRLAAAGELASDEQIGLLFTGIER